MISEHQHWELDENGQPTGHRIARRRRAEFITPFPKPKKRRGSRQEELDLDEGKGLSTKKQAYDLTSIINEVRGHCHQVIVFTCRPDDYLPTGGAADDDSVAVVDLETLISRQV